MFWRSRKVPEMPGRADVAKKIVRDGGMYISELESIMEEVDTGKLLGLILATQVRDIAATGRQIMEIASNNEEAAFDLRTFIDYYFPMTIKLVKAYTESCARAGQCGNSDAIVEKVRSVMDQVVDAFHKQLDAMFAAKKLDIKTDVEVLRQVIKLEGL